MRDRRSGSPSSSSRAAASPLASRSGTTSAVSRSTATAPMPPAGVATTGVADASASRTTFGSPSTLPASSRTEGHGRDIGGGQPSGDLPLRHRPQPDHAIRDAARCRALSQLAVEVAAPGQHEAQLRALRGERAGRVDEVLEALLADQASGREHDAGVPANAVAVAQAVARGVVRPEPLDVDAVGHHLRAVDVPRPSGRLVRAGPRCTRSPSPPARRRSGPRAGWPRNARPRTRPSRGGSPRAASTGPLRPRRRRWESPSGHAPPSPASRAPRAGWPTRPPRARTAPRRRPRAASKRRRGGRRRSRTRSAAGPARSGRSGSGRRLPGPAVAREGATARAGAPCVPGRRCRGRWARRRCRSDRPGTAGTTR